jgi:hypothetical protein
MSVPGVYDAESSDNPNNALIKDCMFYRNTEKLSGICRLRSRLNANHYCLHHQQLQARYGDPLFYIREVFSSNSTKFHQILQFDVTSSVIT